MKHGVFQGFISGKQMVVVNLLFAIYLNMHQLNLDDLVINLDRVTENKTEHLLLRVFYAMVSFYRLFLHFYHNF